MIKLTLKKELNAVLFDNTDESKTEILRVFLNLVTYIWTGDTGSMLLKTKDGDQFIITIGDYLALVDNKVIALNKEFVDYYFYQNETGKSK